MIERIAAGRIAFEGRDITAMPVHRRALLGISRTFQITNLFPTLTVAENMQLALRGTEASKFSLFGSTQLNEDDNARVAQALSISRLGARTAVAVHELSYGEQRQLEMAMALVAQPRLLLLDEPAAGLSPSERVIVADIIRSLPRDLTMVLIEHDMELALKLVDWVTCLNNGQMLAEGSPQSISADQRVQDVYLGKARGHA